MAIAQVVAMRLPLEAVLPHLPAILEGVLLWAADSKNKFKLKARCHADLPDTLALLRLVQTIFNNDLENLISTKEQPTEAWLSDHRRHPNGLEH